MTYTSNLSFAIGIFIFFLYVRKNNTQTKDATTQTPKQIKCTKIIQTQTPKQIKCTKIIQTQTPQTKDATTQTPKQIKCTVVDYCPRV